MTPTHEQFARDFALVNDFYASQDGLQRPGGMVIDRGGIPTCDVEAMQQWGWQLMRGTPVGVILWQIRQSDEWKTKHANDPVPPFVPLPALVARGQFFRERDTGRRHTVVGASEFNLLARFVAGEDIEPVLSQLQELGFNWARVFTAFNIGGIGALRPLPEVYEAIPAFLKLCARYGVYVELVAFTGPYTRARAAELGIPVADPTFDVFEDQGDMEAHWENLKAVLEQNPVELTNVSLEMVNEADNTPNLGIPFELLIPPASHVLASHGSSTADEWPVEPVWGYGAYHSNDLNEWWRKTGHNSMEVAAHFGVPVIGGENTRMPDKDDSLYHAEDAAEAAALLCAGSCFHSTAGKQAQILEGRTLECARAWARGARKVPLEFQDGQYNHPQHLEVSGILRAYQRVLGDGRVYTVLIRG